VRPGKGCGTELVCCSPRCRFWSGKTSQATERREHHQEGKDGEGGVLAWWCRVQELSDQFEEPSRKTPAGKTVLDVNAVKEAIGLTQPWFDDLLLRISGGGAIVL